MEFHVLRSQFLKTVSETHGIGEATAMFREVYLHVTGKDPVHPLRQEPVNETICTNVLNIANELARGKPLQYVLGYAHFCENTFRVNPDVLIPRPETEELVTWIAHDFASRPPAHILDIGTGSGCIAISLAKTFPNAHITAIDKSEAALKVARRNADEILGTDHKIKWLVLDYLVQLPDKIFDLIVSNPPYILLKNNNLVDSHVLAHEPSMALFAPGEDGLIFYRKIAKQLQLQVTGSAYAELHAGTAEQVRRMFNEQVTGAEVAVKPDMNGTLRMIRCIKKGS